MSERESQQPNSPAPQDANRVVTENLRGVIVFIEDAGDTTRRPADPKILEWYRRHQQPDTPPKPPEDEKDEKGEKA